MHLGEPVAKPKPKKKPTTAKPAEIRVPPMTDDELHTYSIEHLYYELEMLFFMREWLVSPDAADRELIVNNALIEAFLIHARSLTAFLHYAPNPKHPDDVTAEHYVADVEEWRAARGPMPEVLKVLRDRTGREIAHLTTQRHPAGSPKKAWSPQEIILALTPRLKAFVAYVPPQRIDWRFRVFLNEAPRDG